MDVPRCSVIVCCYNSSRRLPETLLHLARQQTDRGTAWEVVLVDNASTDDTATVAVQTWRALGATAPLRVISEPTPGQAHARVTGLRAAAHDVVIFCDDDNWLAPDYVNRAVRLMAERPEIGVAGGSIEPAWEMGAPVPEWFYTYASAYAVGVQATRSGDVSERGYVWGAGMVLRGSLLKFFHTSGAKTLLGGRSGKGLLSGDDSEICKWYLMAGYALWYEASLRLSHFVPQGRQSLDYVEGLLGGFTAAAPTLAAYDAWIARKNARRRWWRAPRQFLWRELVSWKRARHLNAALRRLDRLAADFRRQHC